MMARRMHAAGGTSRFAWSRRRSFAVFAERAPFWATCALILIAFLIGGSARADVQSLIVLRPIAVLLLGYGLIGLRREQIRENWFLFAVAGFAIASTLLQLIPLPPEIWSKLPGRHIVVEIDQAAQLGSLWRPLTLAPLATWNALFALLVPFAVLVLGVRLSPEERWQLIPLMLGIGLVSALLGVLQMGSGAGGPLYFYRITNDGSAVGLFANRNHQAIFLASLIPMLAVYASAGLTSRLNAKVKAFVAVAFGCFIIALILVIGSRAGLLVAALGLLGALLLYRPRLGRNGQQEIGRSWRIGLIIGIAALLGLAALTVLLGRGEAFNRMLAHGGGEEFRYRAWRPILDMVWQYFPVGSGFGSFVQVYQMGEPRELLRVTYFNHAHNDWLELTLTGGVVVLAALALVTVAYLAKVARLSRLRGFDRQNYLLAWAGALIIFIFGVVSVADYPLRVPSLGCLFVLAAIWLNTSGTISGPRKTG